MPRSDRPESILAELEALHRDIDRRAVELADRHAARLRCGRGCSSCCLDDLTVLAVEAAGIRRKHARLLTEGRPNRPGACAFLDAEGACRIYAERPSVCRSQGLPLRVLFEDEDGEVAERRDICGLNLEGGPPLAALAEDDCWLIGPVELKLLDLDERLSGAAAPRVALRALFEATDPL